jgi:hypothetical protein
VVALVLALGLQRGEVRSGARFGIALAPARLARDDVRQEFLLLLFIGVFEQDGTKHPDAERGERGAGVDALHLLVEHDGFGFREAATAVFLRPGRRGPALGGHALEPDFRVRVDEFLVAAAPDDFVLDHRSAHGLRAVGFEPGARFGAELFDVGHVSLPVVLSSYG